MSLKVAKNDKVNSNDKQEMSDDDEDVDSKKDVEQKDADTPTTNAPNIPLTSITDKTSVASNTNCNTSKSFDNIFIYTTFSLFLSVLFVPSF